MTDDSMIRNQDEVTCVAAYLDILGFKAWVGDDSKRAILIESLRLLSSIPSGGKQITRNEVTERTVPLRVRSFSDSIVLYAKGPQENLPQLLFVIRHLQDSLWRIGICLRGSAVMGQIYWPESDDKITIGKGFVDAYELERDVAIYPRVVVSKNLYDFIDMQKVVAEPFGTCDKLCDLFREDFDGVFFLDLLNPMILRNSSEQLFPNLENDTFTIKFNENAPSSHREIVEAVEKIIEENRAHREQSVRQKFAWLKTYLQSAKQAAQ